MRKFSRLASRGNFHSGFQFSSAQPQSLSLRALLDSIPRPGYFFGDVFPMSKLPDLKLRDFPGNCSWNFLNQTHLFPDHTSWAQVLYYKVFSVLIVLCNILKSLYNFFLQLATIRVPSFCGRRRI
jgi:hypothetical protein